MLTRLLCTLTEIHTKLEAIMATAQNFRDLLTAINVETDRLAVKIQELIDRVTASDLTGAEETEVLAGLTAIKDRLGVIGANQSDPVPAV